MAQRTVSLGGMAGLALLGALLSLSPAYSLALDVQRKSQTPAKCNLAGTWVNDLGSKMVIGTTNEDGQFSGSYLTAVSAVTDATIQESPLHGRQHHTNRRAQPTFGLTVSWSFSDSTTVFVGQCFVDEKGEETLETTWLLREEVATHADDWKANRVGKNVFVRVK
ncbi:avidin-like [Podarcis raffonei]|uniref:avidin-like n=1 Tax=Podarcis raffonei TaxID=65483 RepID=UPI0023294D5E|nr:avidin-like [Podarcis raffonei]